MKSIVTVWALLCLAATLLASGDKGTPQRGGTRPVPAAKRVFVGNLPFNSGREPHQRLWQAALTAGSPALAFHRQLGLRAVNPADWHARALNRAGKAVVSSPSVYYGRPSVVSSPSIYGRPGSTQKPTFCLPLLGTGIRPLTSMSAEDKKAIQ